MVHHNPREGNGYSHGVPMQRYQPTQSKLLFIQGIKVIQELDDYGNHRLFVDKRWSEWTGYESFSSITFAQGYVVGRTEFWDGELDWFPKTACLVFKEK
jgi:hypothetical protein